MWIIILRYAIILLLSSGALGITYGFYSWLSKINWSNIQLALIGLCMTIILYVFLKGYWDYKIAKLNSNPKGEKK